ncbi:hypothetical protein [Actinokineospora sp.]|uniref:hypothetical protein n=1 Tax=Actinokineospora sp. TaxID=1872133 RepID=UPI003D6A6FD3
MNARRWLVGITVGVVGLGLVGLGIMLFSRGLDSADKLASVGSLFVGLASLGVAGFALRGRPREPERRKRADGRVTGGVVGGSVVGVESGTGVDDIVAVVDVGDVLAGGSVTGAKIVEDKDG